MCKSAENLLESMVKDWTESNQNKNSNQQNNSLNIFRVLKIQNKEVLICRLLREFLDPLGSHGLGTLPLKLFLKQITGEDDYEEEDLQNATAIAEEETNENRRIDIVIYLYNLTIPIEVKIWAGDQEEQLKDYYKYCFNNDKNSKIYYLTPIGHAPSKQSSEGIENCVVQLSFKKDISNWIDKIIFEGEDLPIATNQILNQLKGIIEDMCAEYNSLDSLFNVLSLENDCKFEIENNDKLKFVINLLNNKKAILERFWQLFINEYIKFNTEKYSLVISTKDEKNDIKYSVMSVKDGGKTIAWLCIQDNLYLICNGIVDNPKYKKVWNREKHPWIYLSPDGIGKKFNLHSPNCKELTGKPIYIDDVLRDIGQSNTDSD